MNYYSLFHYGLPDLDWFMLITKPTKLGTSVAPIDLKSPAHLLGKSGGLIVAVSFSSTYYSN